MGKVKVQDGLVNLVANLGAGKDVGTQWQYVHEQTDVNQVMVMYGSSANARKIVDIPANDATRHWRTWDNQDMTTLEVGLGLQRKVRQALVMAQVQGGAAIFMNIAGVGKDDLREPLVVTKDTEVTGLTVLGRNELTSSEQIMERLDDDYGLGLRYFISESSFEVHRSRFLWFRGKETDRVQRIANGGWDNSIYNGLTPLIQAADASVVTMLSLIDEAKKDVISVEGLATMLQEVEGTEAVASYLSHITTLAGVNNILLLDRADNHEQKVMQYNGIVEVVDAAQRTLGGHVGIPATRFLGEQSKGLGDSGSGDMRVYHEMISGIQHNIITPTLSVLDTIMTNMVDMKALVTWSPLNVPTKDEQVNMVKLQVDTLVAAANTGGLSDDELGKLKVYLLGHIVA